MAIHKPVLVSKYFYSKKDLTMYVKVGITIPMDANEDLEQIIPKAHPSLLPIKGNKTRIEYLVIPGPSPNPFDFNKDQFIILMESLNLIDSIRETQGKMYISFDISTKSIKEYEIEVVVREQDSTIGGQTTTTISGNAEIEFEEP